MKKLCLRWCVSFLAMICMLACNSSTEKTRKVSTSEVKSTIWKPVALKYATQWKLFESQDSYKIVSIGIDENTMDSIVVPKRNASFKRIASGSCTFSKFFEVLGRLDQIEIIDNADYYFSPAMISRINSNQVKEYREIEPSSVELFLQESIDLFLCSGYTYGRLQEERWNTMNIDIFPLQLYLEEHPLGKLEWIKCVGIISGRLQAATSYFNAVSQQYEALQAQETNTITPSLINFTYHGTWHLPGSSTYIYTLLKDAGIGLPVVQEKGVRPLDIESVYQQFGNSLLWLHPGPHRHYETMLQAEPRSALFTAFEEHHIFNNTKRSLPSGGNDFYEQGVLRPDLVLKDLLRIREKFQSSESTWQEDLVFYTELIRADHSVLNHNSP